MSRIPPLPGRRVLQHYREGRSQRLTTLKAIRESLVSVAGLVGRPVRNQKGAEIGDATEAEASEGLIKFLRDHGTGAVPEHYYDRYVKESADHLRQSEKQLHAAKA